MSNKKIYNPVKEEGPSRSSKVIWSTEVLRVATEALDAGKRLKTNPFYERNTKILKGDLVFERTEDEIREWLRCRDDMTYFANHYCKLMTPQGIQNIKLRDYQQEYLKHLEDCRLSIFLSCRQSGKTTTTAIALLHYICFNVDKNSLVLGNKRKTAIEILSKIKDIFVELPFFLKPGVYKWNESEIALDNGCRIQAEATTLNSAIGQTVHCLILDEFAHINPNIKETFYNNIFPTVSAAQAKVYITSTQNGYDLFYRLYQAAVEGTNDYKPFKVDWWQVPEWDPKEQKWHKRDEGWRQKQIANLGSEEAFNSQFGTSFDISANTLIRRNVLQKKSTEVLQFETKDLAGVTRSESWFWRPDIDPMNLRQKCLIITCDLAEGAGGDFTAFTIWWATPSGEQCIGFFRSNTISRGEAARSLCLFICKWTDQNRTLLSYEANTYGDIFLSDIEKLAEKDLEISTRWDPSVLVKYYNESGTSWKYGFKFTPGNKTSNCVLFKESYERGKTVNDSHLFHNELLNFSDDGTGRYKAGYGHDDLVMSAVQLEPVKLTIQYKNLKSMMDAPNESTTFYNPYEIDPSQTPGAQYFNDIYDPLGANLDPFGANLDPFGTRRRLK